MHFPKGQGYTEEYFNQLTAEVKKTTFESGWPKQHYEKIRERNEALDIRVYLTALPDMLRPNLTAIAKRLKPADESGGQSAPKEYVLRPRPETPKASEPEQPEPSQPEPPRRAPAPRVKIKVGGGGGFGRGY
jgi:phage terminase large subunit GpA-like protein